MLGHTTQDRVLDTVDRLNCTISAEMTRKCLLPQGTFTGFFSVVHSRLSMITLLTFLREALLTTQLPSAKYASAEGQLPVCVFRSCVPQEVDQLLVRTETP